MRPLGASHIAVSVVLVAGLGACSDGGDVAGPGGCGGDAPVIALDHDTTDPDRGIGGGVPEVSVVSGDGDVEMVTGSWVASQAAFSPDGERLVVVKADGDYESAGPSSTALWVVGTGGIDGTEPQELTRGDVLDEDPDWSADGSSIVFVRLASGPGGYTSSIATVPAAGGEPTELLDAGEDGLDRPVWSPDGRRIAFVRSVYDGGSVESTSTVWTMAADGTGARPLVRLRYVSTLDWHPDGSSLLVDTGGEDQETHLVDVGTGRARSLGTGADLARWSPDGESVYYFRERHEADRGRVRWNLVEGRVEDEGLVDARTVLAADELGDTVLADVGLSPGFSLAVGPCG